jgi:hypothetical protein
MDTLFAHITTYDTPSLWLAFGCGLLLGVGCTYAMLFRRTR